MASITDCGSNICTTRNVFVSVHNGHPLWYLQL